VKRGAWEVDFTIVSILRRIKSWAHEARGGGKTNQDLPNWSTPRRGQETNGMKIFWPRGPGKKKEGKQGGLENQRPKVRQHHLSKEWVGVSTTIIAEKGKRYGKREKNSKEDGEKKKKGGVVDMGTVTSPAHTDRGLEGCGQNRESIYGGKGSECIRQKQEKKLPNGGAPAGGWP